MSRAAILAGVGAALAMLAAVSMHEGPSAVDDKAAVNPPASLDAEDLRGIAELPLVAARLRDRLEQEPADPDGWALLARTYVALGKHTLAQPAYRKALALRGDDAALLADYADTLAFLNGRSFEGEPRQLIERALRIDPANPGALVLAGLAAFDRRDYAQAAAQWEKATKALGPGSPMEAQVRGGIREARRRAGPAADDAWSPAGLKEE